MLDTTLPDKVGHTAVYGHIGRLGGAFAMYSPHALGGFGHVEQTRRDEGYPGAVTECAPCSARSRSPAATPPRRSPRS